jgi:broad specificity phosphatase PhoE
LLSPGAAPPAARRPRLPTREKFLEAAALCEDRCMGRILLVRHAQSVWNAAGRWQGWSDAPLSDVGVAQAERAGRALAEHGFAPASVACSDLARARQTAELLARRCAYRGTLTLDPALREQGLGDWEGLTNDQISARWPGSLEARNAGIGAVIPQGEPEDAFSTRVLEALQRISSRSRYGEVLVVTHGGVVMVLERALGVWGPERRHPNLAGWWLEVTDGPGGAVLKPLEPIELLTMPASGAA